MAEILILLLALANVGVYVYARKRWYWPMMNASRSLQGMCRHFHLLLPGKERGANALVERLQALLDAHERLKAAHQQVLQDQRELKAAKAALKQLQSRQAALAEQHVAATPSSPEAGKAAWQNLWTVINHEIRTPLNAVVGMSSLISPHALSQEERQFLQSLQLHAEKLTDVFDELNTLVHLQLGRLELEYHSFSLGSCVEDVLDILAERARQQQLELMYYLHPDIPPRFIGDHEHLQYVLLCLLEYALANSGPGDICLHLNRVGREENEYELHFSILHNRPGVWPDEKKLRYMPFEAARISIGMEGRNTLGLYIAQQLIGLMEGSLGIEREGWQGNSFYFSLKLSADPSTPPLHPSLKEGNPQGAKVLLVDDNATNLRILELLCSKWGMLPRAVQHPLEAYHLLMQEEADFDLLIVDYFMPEMNGLELSALVRKTFSRQALPIIMLSSDAHLPAGGEALLSAFLNKPVRRRELFDSIGFCLHYRQHEGPLNCSQGHFQLRPELAGEIRVLVADDNRVGQKVARQILRKMGIEADVVATGGEVLEAVKSQTYDVIFMDLHMPQMDGLEACRRLRKLYPQPASRPCIIALTVSKHPGDRQRCLDAGMDDFLAKPVNLHSMGNMLHRWLPAAIVRHR